MMSVYFINYNNYVRAKAVVTGLSFLSRKLGYEARHFSMSKTLGRKSTAYSTSKN